MIEEWRIIPEFQSYSVSSLGRVRNEDTGRYMALAQNQHGIVHVGLCRGKVQFKRSVPLLVARAFLPIPTNPSFDSPIQLDGDRINVAADNLAWRPKWFAVKYHLQFHFPPGGFIVPIVEIGTGETFRNSWEAATKYGLLDREIFLATINRTYVWPTYQEFRVID